MGTKRCLSLEALQIERSMRDFENAKCIEDRLKEGKASVKADIKDRRMRTLFLLSFLMGRGLVNRIIAVPRDH